MMIQPIDPEGTTIELQIDSDPIVQTRRPANCPTCPSCPPGYGVGVTRSGQDFTDLLLINNVSYEALQSANPTLPTTRLAPGTRYCIPPSGTRRLCANGTETAIVQEGENLNTLAELYGMPPAAFLAANPQLAPRDFIAGRVVCVP